MLVECQIYGVTSFVGLHMPTGEFYVKLTLLEVHQFEPTAGFNCTENF